MSPSRGCASLQAKQREEAAAKKLEAKQLAAKEEAEIAAKKPAKAKSAATKASSVLASSDCNKTPDNPQRRMI